MNHQYRKNIKPGLLVDIVLKKDQPTGKLTRGTVQDILTSSSEHHRGIKVRLTDGQVGRVQHIVDGSSAMPSQTPKQKTIRIDVWADVVCPFCYIGQHELQKAIAEFEHGDAVTLVLHSYELNPEMPKEFAGTLHEYLAQHKGVSVSDAKAMNADVTQYAAEVGLTFNMDKTVPANSFDAHRLVHLAAEYDLESAAMEKLHAAYFTHGKNIADRAFLISLAVELGIPAKAAEEMYATSEYTDEVREDEARAQEIGVTGVPQFFITKKLTSQRASASGEDSIGFNPKYTITGSQRTVQFLAGLEQVWSEL